LLIGYLLPCFPFLFFYVKGSELSHKCFVIAGGVFQLSLLCFFLEAYEYWFLLLLQMIISGNSDGFGSKFLQVEIFFLMFTFKVTLSVVICGCLSLRNNNYLAFLILIGLILAPSRFGFMVLIIWAAFLFFFENHGLC
jgi:hypothetical protein